MTREPCACEWGTSCDLHAELDELEDLMLQMGWTHPDDGESYGWRLTPSLRARLLDLREWDLWLERMEADA